MSMLSTIRLNLAERLKNRAYRRRYFRSQAQLDVAQQIRALRLKRELRQIDLAKAARMKQSAVSRVEQADYSRWTFTTLLRLADALDAKVKVIFSSAEDVIAEYEQRERQVAEFATQWERDQEMISVRESTGQGGEVLLQKMETPLPRSPIISAEIITSGQSGLREDTPRIEVPMVNGRGVTGPAI